jgi:putative nucleotidyltransferase with HDIG domain
MILVGAVVTYLWRFERETFESESKALLIVLVIFAILLFAGVLSRVSGYLMPVAAGTMLYATIIEPRFAMLMGIVLSLASNIVAGNDLRFLIVCLVGATAGVFGIVHLQQRSSLMRAGIGVSVSSLLTIGALGLADGSPINVNLLEQQFWGILNGVVSAVVTMGSLPFFEGLFGIITPVKLIELSNPNHPLLKKLLVEAPGTYHHSILVGNLAEAATEAVGGNSLLARVGAYYHDVGKTRRPYFFIENQMGGDNPHDKTTPTLSTLIITAHVRDGVEMAKEQGIPERIIEFIREHHGDTLVSYFFTRATEGGSRTEYAEQDFRYEGPRPTSKETAIVMLADSVEAAVRSMGILAASRIETAVRKIIRDKLNDHQLDKCDLTLGDLDVIAQVFTSVLTGIFHPRIEYPEEKPEKPKAGPAPQNESRGNSLKKKRLGIRRSARRA